MRRGYVLGISMLVVASVPAMAAVGCGSSSGAGSGGTSVPPAVYVIDSTATLFAFDGQGNLLSHASLPTPIGALNGGGMTLASGAVYVTVGQQTNRVSAYDATTLAPHSLSASAFAGLSVPRGIAYDSNVSEFFVGNGAATVNVFDASGGAAAPTGSFPGHYGPSGVAYDSDDHTIWVANYVGSTPASPPHYGVTEYTQSGDSAQTFDYASQFVSPASPTEPYSIAVCLSAATGGAPLVLVGFIDDGSGQGTRSVQAYSTSGAPVGAPAQGSLTNPYSIACSTSGTVYVADRSGLYQGTIGSSGLTGLGPASGFAGLTPPIYGVLVAPSTGSGDGGGLDATTGEGGEGGGPDASEAGADAAGEAGASNEAGIPSCAAGSTSSIYRAPGPPACALPTPGEDGGPVQIGSGEECELSPDVTASMSIARSPCGVYDAPQGLVVSGSGTVLTIEPGTTIAFGNNTALQVSGGAGIVIGAPPDGGPCAPVVFTSDSPTPTAGAWGKVLLQTPAPVSSIANLVIQYAGSVNPAVGWAGAASLALDGVAAGMAGITPSDFTMQLSNVTVSNNGSVPVVFVGNHTGPAPGSSLTITDAPSGADLLAIYPDAAGMLSNLTVSGPPTGTIHLTTGSTGDNTIDTTQTWPSICPLNYTLAEPSGPYVIGSNGDEGEIVVSAQMDAGAVVPGDFALTIANPNTLQVGSAFDMNVGGSLTASGITFQSLPGAGPWSGMTFYYPGLASSVLSNVAFVNAGGGGAGAACGPNAPTVAFSLQWLAGLGGPCEPPPPWSNLSFPDLNSAYAIDAVALSPSDAVTLASQNPGVAVFSCTTPQCAP